MLRAEIDANPARFAAAIARGDAAGAAAVYANGATLLPPDGEALWGRMAIERFWRGGIRIGIRRVQLDALEVGQAESLAYEVGCYRFLVAREGDEPTAEVGKYVVIHRRQSDNSWKRAIDIFNRDAPSRRSTQGGQPVRKTRKQEEQ